MSSGRCRIAELAKSTGVAVGALHSYCETGLVRPTAG